jgi:hypothetical protein
LNAARLQNPMRCADLLLEQRLRQIKDAPVGWMPSRLAEKVVLRGETVPLSEAWRLWRMISRGCHGNCLVMYRRHPQLQLWSGFSFVCGTREWQVHSWLRDLEHYVWIETVSFRDVYFGMPLTASEFVRIFMVSPETVKQFKRVVYPR